MVVLTLLIGGGRRVRHVRYSAGDPLVARAAGCGGCRRPRTIGRWLAQFRARHLRAAAAALNAELVAAAPSSDWGSSG